MEVMVGSVGWRSCFLNMFPHRDRWIQIVRGTVDGKCERTTADTTLHGHAWGLLPVTLMSCRRADPALLPLLPVHVAEPYSPSSLLSPRTLSFWKAATQFHFSQSHFLDASK